MSCSGKAFDESFTQAHDMKLVCRPGLACVGFVQGSTWGTCEACWQTFCHTSGCKRCAFFTCTVGFFCVLRKGAVISWRVTPKQIVSVIDNTVLSIHAWQPEQGRTV